MVIMINGKFPGPQIDCETDDILIITVHNYLDEPFLLSWNGLQNRRNSFQDGMPGTTSWEQQMCTRLPFFYCFFMPGTCPIKFRRNFRYILQAKDQIGSFYYFPSLYLHKAFGGYGAILIHSRPRIPVPFPQPAGDFTVLAGVWYKSSHRQMMLRLQRGQKIGLPDGLLINGRGWNGYTFTVQQGRTYRFRISNVGISTSINFRIAGHRLKLVEVEGTHTMQSTYTSLDVHLGQSYSVLVTADQPPADYYVVVSTRFTEPAINTTAVLHYKNSGRKVSGPLPGSPTTQIAWSLHQARTIRMDDGQWTPRSRASYNLKDAVARSNVQVYPRAWTAIYVSLDNVGMWKIRSEDWERQYLGQQCCIIVQTRTQHALKLCKCIP